MSSKFDFVIVGGGIVGLATAYKLQLKFPKKTIAILEKEINVAMHQTGRNSGVIHSGIYYKPDSYKAKNSKIGGEQLIAFAKQTNVKVDVCGKIIVATNKSELPKLEEIYQRGIQNKTAGIQFLSSEEIKQKEPFIEGIKAIWVPTAGIIDYVGVCKAFVSEIIKINATSSLITNCEVLNSQISENKTIIKTSIGNFEAEKVIYCGGLQSDRKSVV